MLRKNKRTSKRKEKINRKTKKKTFGGFNIRLKKAAGKHSAGKRR